MSIKIAIPVHRRESQCLLIFACIRFVIQIVQTEIGLNHLLSVYKFFFSLKSIEFVIPMYACIKILCYKVLSTFGALGIQRIQIRTCGTRDL